MTTGFSETLANVISIYGLLPRIAVPGPASAVATPIATLLSAVSDLETDTVGNAPAIAALSPALTGVAAINTLTAAGTPITASTGTITVLTQIVDSALAAATIVAANNLNATLCTPTVQALSDFQTAVSTVTSTFVVSGVYDSATQDALATALGTGPKTCPGMPITPVTTIPTLPPPTPTPTPTSTSTTSTTTTTTAAPASNTALYVVGGVAVVALGALALAMSKRGAAG